MGDTEVGTQKQVWVCVCVTHAAGQKCCHAPWLAAAHSTKCCGKGSEAGQDVGGCHVSSIKVCSCRQGHLQVK